MNRKQKIIVSITGIFLVLMILVGVTYGYFLTKIYKNNFLNHENGLYDKLKEYQTTKLNNYLEYLSPGKWCYDDRAYSDTSGTNKLSESEIETYYQNKKAFYYAPYVRLVTNKSPSLKCEGTELSKYRDSTDMYVGTLTADEMTFAGTIYGMANFNNYLMNDNSLFKKVSWTISPFDYGKNIINGIWYERAFNLYYNGNTNNNSVPSGYGVRPSINIKSSIEINDGDGTRESPYVIFTD